MQLQTLEGGEVLLNELIAIFDKAYKVKGDQLIVDSYLLKPGAYIKVDSSNQWQIKCYDRKSSPDEEEYRWFARRDYLSGLLAMNKPIDPKKKIHSNNYLTFFMKKELLMGAGAIPQKELSDRIEEYYRILENPIEKYKKKKKSLELFKTIQTEINTDKLNKAESFIKENLQSVLESLKEITDNFDNYIKIFFDEPIELYEQESERYMVPNLFNNNEYNKEIEGKIFGLTNNNMNLNSKKPYLEHKTMRNTIPCYVTSEDIMVHKKFFDWLGTRGTGALYIANNSNFIRGIEREVKAGRGAYYFLYLKQGKGPEIHSYDFLPYFDSEEKLEVENYINATSAINKQEGQELFTYRRLKKRHEIEAYVSEVFFYGKLERYYKKEPSDLKGMSQELKNLIILTSESLFQYFKLGDRRAFSKIIKRYGLEYVKIQLRDGQIRGTRAYNLYIGLLSQKGGMSEMPGRLNEITSILREKISDTSIVDLAHDEEYYFLSGQIVYYLLAQSKAKSDNRKHSMVNAFLDCKKDSRLRKEIFYSFQKYSHELSMNYRKFDHALAMTRAYTCDDERVDMNMFLAGYLGHNLFFESKKEVEMP